MQHLPERLQSEPALPLESLEPSQAKPTPERPEADAPDFAELLQALRACSGNVARAAQSLGISRQRAYRMMQGRAELDLDALRAPGSEP